ncbi:MAG: tetraacyldisaccharide 4'-kinase [Chlamydiae bacterium]|nr:tetraacyldisaccharide 4'-kinase [Chlamydiota bacterium]
MKLKAKFFLYIQNGIEQDRLPFFLKGLLYFLSFFWAVSSQIKNFLYDRKVFKSKKIEKICVISVGNIVVGGSGKTPFTILLTKKLLNQNRVIISRGYQSKSEQKSLVATDFTKTSAEEIGDEPFLLLKQLKVPLIVGKDRLASLEIAKSLKAKVAILDDGMQYRRVYKDFEIVILNALDLFGKNNFLPRGFLREGPKNLKRASLIVINNVRNEEHFTELKKEVDRFFKGPIIGTKPKIACFYDLDDKEIALEAGSKIFAFCAIAHPEPFFDLLKEAGFNIEKNLILLDHEKIDCDEMKKLSNEAKSQGAKCIICTQKDVVKLDKNKTVSLPIYACAIDLKIVANESIFNEFLAQMERSCFAKN